jgi:hypothetical protein
MPKRALIAVALIASSVLVSAQQKPAASNLRIVVIAGEGAVNIIQQKTAVAPIVEIRDRNNLPVAGATVTFSVSGSGATFGTGSTLTVVTNAAGQATAAGLTPTAAGALQVNVSAAFQGQLASAAITQTNFATAQAAAAASAGGGGGGAAGGGAAGAAGGGGIGTTTLVIAGAAVAGGAVAAQQAGLIGGGADGFIMILGRVFSTIRTGGVGGCTGAPGGNTVTPPECYGPPVAGAVASTSLDGNTATTDAAGNFDITTTIPRSQIEECRAYTLTINAIGFPTFTVNIRGFSGNRQGNEHRQDFSLSPPSPTTMGSGC